MIEQKKIKMGPPPEQTEEPPPAEPPDKIIKEEVMLAVKTTDSPLNTIGENGMFIVANEEVHVHLQYARLPKPIWPKSPVTIPSTYFRDIHRRVSFRDFKILLTFLKCLRKESILVLVFEIFIFQCKETSKQV